MEKVSLHSLLGFDFGMKHIGVAVGQTITKTARALSTLKAVQGIPSWDEVDQLVKTWKPDAMIVGLPLNMDGTEQSITRSAKQFADSLKERYQLPVYAMDERLTTREAKEQLFQKGGYTALKKEKIDSLSAALILQSWLNQTNH